MPSLRSVCVFCGSAAGSAPIYLDAARTFGTLLARRGLTLVYGGARVGLMGAVADAALAAGGAVVGVMPRGLWDREIGHTGLTEMHIVESMHERKALMAMRSDAFVALPGGAGTLDELFEAWTWAQIGIHDKPIALLDVDGYYQPLLAALDHMAAQGFIRPAQRAMLVVEREAEALLARLAP
jgi:uncharacterized protein (TIGR00730 family)